MRYSAVFLLSIVLAGPASQEAVGAESDEALTPELVARRLWNIIQVVQEQHVQPPAREALCRAVLESAGRGQAGVAQIAKIADEKAWVELLKERWAADQKSNQAELPAAGASTVALIAVPALRLPVAPALVLFPNAFQPLSLETWQTTLLGAIAKSIPGGIRFVSKSDFKIEQQFQSNRYVGTGIQIRMDPTAKLAALVYCFPGGPARLAGGLPGDLIVEIDGKNMEGCRLTEVVDRLRGDEGTPVTMVVRQPGAKEKRALKMVRSVIPFTSIEGYRRKAVDDWDFHVEAGSPIAYVRLESLRVSTLHELRQLEPQLQAQGFRGLILDIRFMGFAGEGDHDTALVADALLENGVLWRVHQNGGRVNELRADRDCLFRGWPVVLLIDGLGIPRAGNGAALLAAALQDNRRALLVGNSIAAQPFLDQYVSLSDGLGVVRLANARVERYGPPSKRDLMLVEPDHKVPRGQKEAQAWAMWRLDQAQERNLSAKPPADPQLDKALQVLRAALAASAEPAKKS